MTPQNQYLYCADLPTLPTPGLGTILVTGASGYIGGRLVPELLARGYRVRVMVRSASQDDQIRYSGAEVAEADALNPDSLRKALNGVHTAYYLIHSLLLGLREFESADHQAAANFRTVAAEQGVRRIIYLGGLGDHKTTLSPHLRSRIQVAEELSRGPVPATIFRAAIIIGSGSASYEIIEHLVRNTRALPIPYWARTRCQPIAIRDVVKYLVGALETPDTAGRSFDIGGDDILTYEEMLRTLADILGRRIFYFPSPVSNIPLYAYLASLLTPVPHSITRVLLESSASDVICRNTDIRRIIPFRPLFYREALVLALSRELQDQVSTRWSDAYPPAHELAIKLREVKPAPRFVKSYSLLTPKPPYALFRSICRVGGDEGWFNSNFLWKMRGWMDRLLLGVGTSRGRKRQPGLRINDVIDFWRVEDIRVSERLLLRAEMKIPGRAWLEFTLAAEAGGTRLTIRAHYDARTMGAKAYWFFFLPFHAFIFKDLIRQIEKRS